MRNVLTAILLGTLGLANMATASAQSQRPIGELKPVVTLRIGTTADWVAVTPDAVWVGTTGPNAVHKIDPRTNAEVASVALPAAPCAGRVTGFGNLWIPLCAVKPAKPTLAKRPSLSELPATVVT
jgi:streptogramin lyase